MKTAVEWLVDLLETQKFITKSQIFIAGEMEKQQIVDAYSLGDKNIFHSNKTTEQRAEQYYNETFK